MVGSSNDNTPARHHSTHTDKQTDRQTHTHAHTPPPHAPLCCPVDSRGELGHIPQRGEGGPSFLLGAEPHAPPPRLWSVGGLVGRWVGPATLQVVSTAPLPLQIHKRMRTRPNHLPTYTHTHTNTHSTQHTYQIDTHTHTHHRHTRPPHTRTHLYDGGVCVPGAPPQRALEALSRLARTVQRGDPVS